MEYVNIDTQMMTVEEYTGAVQLLGILLYFLLPTLSLILIVYGVRKVLRKRSERVNKDKQESRGYNINKANTINNSNKHTRLDINSTSDKELSHRIDIIEKSGKPEKIGSLTLTFDKDGKIEH